MTVAVDEDGSLDLDALTEVDEDSIRFCEYVAECEDSSVVARGLLELASERPDGNYLLADVWAAMEDTGERITREQ